MTARTQTRPTMTATIAELHAYCGMRMAHAELYAMVDFATPQRVAAGIADPDYREAFEIGVSRAYDADGMTPECKAWANAHPEAKTFYRTFCVAAHIRGSRA